MKLNILSNHFLPIVQNDLFQVRRKKSLVAKEKNTRSNRPLPFVQIDLLQASRKKGRKILGSKSRIYRGEQRLRNENS